MKLCQGSYFFRLFLAAIITIVWPDSQVCGLSISVVASLLFHLSIFVHLLNLIYFERYLLTRASPSSSIIPIVVSPQRFALYLVEYNTINLTSSSFFSSITSNCNILL